MKDMTGTSEVGIWKFIKWDKILRLCFYVSDVAEAVAVIAGFKIYFS